MHPSTNAIPFDQLRASLEWAERLFEQQPDDLRQEYEQAGRIVAELFIRRRYSTAIQLPPRIDHENMLHIPSALTRLRVGSLANRFLRKPIEPGIIHRLHSLCQHTNFVVSESSKLTCYLAAHHLLVSLPDQATLLGKYTAFDRQGRLSAESESQALAILDHLSQCMEWLHIAEQLYPGWTTQDLYNEVSASLTAHIVEQGHALAVYSTQRLILTVRENWQAGKITRGLTLFVPYLDERCYRMREYKVVVIPTGRILFRPEFVAGACRLAQRHIRKDPSLSQSTRWQLLSQLDSILRAFETEIHSPD